MTSKSLVEVVRELYPELSGELQLLIEREESWLGFIENPLQDTLSNPEEMNRFFLELGVSNFYKGLEPELTDYSKGKERRDLTIRADKVQIKPVEWLIEDVLIKAGVHLLGGDPQVGKSYVTTYLGGTLSSGNTCMGVNGIEPQTIMYLSAEDNLSSIATRLLSNGANLENIYLYDSEGLTFPSGLDKLKIEIAQKKPNVIFIDTLNSFVDDGIDTYKDSSIRKLLKPFKKIAEYNNVCFVFITHLNKSPNPKAIYRFNGSIGSVGFARVGLFMAKEEDSDERIVSIVKTNEGKMKSFKFVWSWDSPDVLFLGETELKANDIGLQQTEPELCSEDIIQELEERENNSMLSTALQVKLKNDYSKSTYNRAIKLLKSKNLIKHKRVENKVYVVLVENLEQVEEVAQVERSLINE